MAKVYEFTIWTRVAQINSYARSVTADSEEEARAKLKALGVVDTDGHPDIEGDNHTLSEEVVEEYVTGIEPVR